MPRANLKTTTFDAEELKQALIEYLESTNEFGDFNYEGSAINTVVDLLVRNSTYNAYLANMMANESFIDSAQLRGNVVSHAEKLSYTPRSYTASMTSGSISVAPVVTTGLPNFLEMNEGFVLLSNQGSGTFSFVTKDSYILKWDSQTQTYVGDGIEIFQGQLISNSFIYMQDDKLEIPNERIDTNTLLVTVEDGGEVLTFERATSITEASSTAQLYFLSENYRGRYQIEFGRNVLGIEPGDNAIVTLQYVNTEETHANGSNQFVPASTIDGYSDITFTHNQPAWGGGDRESIEDIRFIAPKYYQAQGRALTDTDYGPIVKAQYPFIKSIITWGGETNNPPNYGTVYLSIISNEGAFLSQSIKDDIARYVNDFNVGSVTPEIVDPYAIGIDLTINFAYDTRKTSKTFNQVSNEINAIVNDYNELRINEFNRYYNNAYLVDQIMDVRGVESVTIDKIIKRTFDVFSDTTNPNYTINFKNPVIPGSISMKDFKVKTTATNHSLYDDEEGNIVIQYNDSGSTVRNEIGTVDYETGVVQFELIMVQEADQVTLYAHPENQNIYIDQNYYAFIGNVDFQPLKLR